MTYKVSDIGNVFIQYQKINININIKFKLLTLKLLIQFLK